MEEEQQPKKGFFSKVKDFFSAKPKEEIIQEAQAPIVERQIKFEECFWCKEPVYEDEHYSKQMGHEFHRKCYKKFLQAGARNKI